jgi:hypothetical protein
MRAVMRPRGIAGNAALIVLLLSACSTTEGRKNDFIKLNNERIGKSLPLYMHETAQQTVNINNKNKRFIYWREDQPNCKYYIDLELVNWVITRWGYLEGKSDCLTPKTNWQGPW